MITGGPKAPFPRRLMFNSAPPEWWTRTTVQVGPRKTDTLSTFPILMIPPSGPAPRPPRSGRQGRTAPPRRGLDELVLSLRPLRPGGGGNAVVLQVGEHFTGPHPGEELHPGDAVLHLHIVLQRRGAHAAPDGLALELGEAVVIGWSPELRPPGVEGLILRRASVAVGLGGRRRGGSGGGGGGGRGGGVGGW